MPLQLTVTLVPALTLDGDAVSVAGGAACTVKVPLVASRIKLLLANILSS
jgi:hypothetical protein